VPFHPQIYCCHPARYANTELEISFWCLRIYIQCVFERRCQNMGPAVDKVSRERLHQSLSRAENSLFFIAARAI
jgi:hypothetical protein